MAAKGLPRGSASADLKHHTRNSIPNHEPRVASPAAGASAAGGPAAGGPASGASAGGGAGAAPVSPSIIGQVPGGPASGRFFAAYFASTIFLRLSKPALYTPSIVSVAVLSFSLSGGVSLKFLRLNLPDQVTSVLLAPSDVTTKVAE